MVDELNVNFTHESFFKVVISVDVPHLQKILVSVVLLNEIWVGDLQENGGIFQFVVIEADILDFIKLYFEIKLILLVSYL